MAVRILGLHINGPQCAAALLVDGKIVCGTAEERLNRQKQSKDFPTRAIAFCLQAEGLKSLEDLDAVAVSWNPVHQMRPGGFQQWRGIVDRLAHAPDNLIDFASEAGSVEQPACWFGFSANQTPSVYYVDHHLSHLAMALYQSPFHEAAVLIADEYGELNSLTFAQAESNSIQVLKRVRFPHSLGIFYATFTELLGYRPNSDEWKVMGAAAYGDGRRFYQKIRALADLKFDPLEFELDLNFFEFANTKVPGYRTSKLDEYLGVGPPAGELEQIHYDLAASCQRVFEDVLFEMLDWLCRKSASRNLAVAGGCFMNSLANGKILERTPFARLFIPYAAADNGGAVGAALWVYHQLLATRRPCPPTRPLRSSVPALATRPLRPRSPNSRFLTSARTA